MTVEYTVGDLRLTLIGLPDELPVRLVMDDGYGPCNLPLTGIVGDDYWLELHADAVTPPADGSA